jgi:peptidoglycan/xylan/chitin deacetylase (PgdA/CDA1 family)
MRLYLGERCRDLTITSRWMERAIEIHTRLDAPCTSFVVGKLLEQHADEFRALARIPQFDLQSHTHSHVWLKSIVEEAPEFRKFWPYYEGRYIDEERGVTVAPGVAVEAIPSELGRVRDLLKEICGVECIGLAGPGGYYRGLGDRLDILEIAWREGVRFSRCYARNPQDSVPVMLDVQPFWYKAQGYPDMLEIPVQGYHDNVWRDLHGWGGDRLDDFLAYLKSNVDAIAGTDWVWCVAFHEWSAIENDPDMRVIEGLIRYAQDRGVELMSCRQFYERRLAARAALS